MQEDHCQITRCMCVVWGVCVCVCVCANSTQKLLELLRLILPLTRGEKIPAKEHIIISAFFDGKQIFLFIKLTTEYHCLLGAVRNEIAD